MPAGRKCAPANFQPRGSLKPGRCRGRGRGDGHGIHPADARPRSSTRSRTRLGRGPAVSWVRRVRFPSRAPDSPELGGMRASGREPEGRRFESSRRDDDGRRTWERTGLIRRHRPVRLRGRRSWVWRSGPTRIRPDACKAGQARRPDPARASPRSSAARAEGFYPSCRRFESCRGASSGRREAGHPAGFGNRRPLVRLQPTRPGHVP